MALLSAVYWYCFIISSFAENKTSANALIMQHVQRIYTCYHRRKQTLVKWSCIVYSDSLAPWCNIMGKIPKYCFILVFISNSLGNAHENHFVVRIIIIIDSNSWIKSQWNRNTQHKQEQFTGDLNRDWNAPFEMKFLRKYSLSNETFLATTQSIDGFLEKNQLRQHKASDMRIEKKPGH